MTASCSPLPSRRSPGRVIENDCMHRQHTRDVQQRRTFRERFHERRRTPSLTRSWTHFCTYVHAFADAYISVDNAQVSTNACLRVCERVSKLILSICSGHVRYLKALTTTSGLASSFLYLPWIGLLKEEVLLPLHHFSNASTSM